MSPDAVPESHDCVLLLLFKLLDFYRKPWGLAHASDFCMENPRELYVDKTQPVKVVLKGTWCRFYLKVQQRRAHDVSQVRRRLIFYTGRRRERSGPKVRIYENLPTGRNQSTFRDLTRF
jgi:hypothetical protein